MEKCRVFILTLLGMVCLFSAAAAAGTHSGTSEAQLYGIQHINLSQEEFLTPWRSYEEHAPQLGPNANQAYCYTPFLVVAADARSKALENAPVMLQDGEKIWQDYAGFLTFTVQLYFSDPNIPKDLSVWIEQKSSKFFAYQVRLPAKNVPVMISPPVNSSHSSASAAKQAQQAYLFTGYYYFTDNNSLHNGPLVLVAAWKDKQYRFYFNMKAIR